MKKILFLILFSLPNYFCLGQNLKTYSGKYKEGQAQYTYYEENYERIFDGDFSYNDNYMSVKGKYKKNKKIGPWEYIYDKNIIIKASYDNDKKFGFWTISRVSQPDKKNHLTNLFFHTNDTICGQIDFPLLSGKLNKEGNFEGNWLLEDYKTEYIAEFSENILVKLIHRNKEDGEIISKFIVNQDSIKLNSNDLKIKKIDLKKISESDFSKVFQLNQNWQSNNVNSMKTFFTLINERINVFFERLKPFDLNLKLKNPELFTYNTYSKDVGIPVYNSAGIDTPPEFVGGNQKFWTYIQKNYQSPEEEGLRGKVMVTFIVEEDGSLSDIKVIKDIGYGTGKEAIRVLKGSPKWKPGIKDGKPVRVQFSLPINVGN